jgi:hypothetical protein
MIRWRFIKLRLFFWLFMSVNGFDLMLIMMTFMYDFIYDHAYDLIFIGISLVAFVFKFFVIILSLLIYIQMLRKLYIFLYNHIL